MAGNNIYVKGSYIDIHDNQNVYLSVDKAQVNVADRVRKDDVSLPENEEKLSSVLASEEAMRYWKRLQEAGFVDKRCHLKQNTTRKQAMYIAEVFGERLGIKSKWKTFERLWGISNLAQEKWDFQQTGTLPSRSKEIDRIFED
ncbi:MAG: hypothetical protein IJV38_07635 [Prevotella sp.]|nr:hypothetical protein [Prevotella sp.]